ncbi:CobW family GTP-binding protein [Metabacillus idriensis]|uniref:CobW family GTP-binding protein n=1 Tax=Metabacillus idriensis TaxID=324768 RepID=UPI003D2B8863
MKKLPVYTVSGFLGSGKTTLLVKMAHELKNRGQKVGIILNELGDENVEKHLFKNQQVHELLNGCICCTIQDDLVKTLKAFKSEQSVDVLLIEGTGVANPLEIKDVLLSPSLIDDFELISMIGIVDSSHYLDYQSMFSSSKEIRSLLKEQIISSDFIILNKIDLAGEKELEKVKKKIRSTVTDDVEIYDAAYGEVPFEKLMENRHAALTLSEEQGHHHHHHSIGTIKIENPQIMDLSELESLLRDIEGLIRAKGHLLVEGTMREMQYAAGKAVLSEEVIESEKTVLILIGQNLPADKIKQIFVKSHT